MTDAQGWTLLAMVGVLLSVIGGLIVNQFHLLRGYLDARFESVEARFQGVDARFVALEASIDARFGAVDARITGLESSMGARFDHLDRDVQALMRDRFGRE